METMPNDPSLGRNGDLGLRPTGSQACSASRNTASAEHIQAQGTMVLEPPPDGGLRAWSQVIAGHLINSLTWYVSTSWVLRRPRSIQVQRKSPLHSTMLKVLPTPSVNFTQGVFQHRLAYINCIIQKHYFYRLRRSLG